MVDILLLAALALFIFVKLGKQFGNVDEEERKRVEDKVKKQQEEIAAIKGRIINHINEVSEAQLQAEEKILSQVDSSIRSEFVEILQRCKITAGFFINGVKSVFEMTLKAFSASDLTALKPLLAENVYSAFEASISERKSRGQNLLTNVIAITNAEIVAVKMINNIAFITMRIFSRQINYIFDEGGQIVEGKKDVISDLVDVWTFKKDLAVADPSWVVCNTSN